MTSAAQGFGDGLGRPDDGYAIGDGDDGDSVKRTPDFGGDAPAIGVELWNGGACVVED